MNKSEKEVTGESAPGTDAVVADRLRQQAEWCRRLGSELYAFLLDKAAADVETGGPCRDLLCGADSEPYAPALALRFMGAVHRIVLTGKAPDLTLYYPSANGTPDWERIWPAFRDAVEQNGNALRGLVRLHVQTNEVGRCAALLGGFLLVSHESHLPLRLFEIGASAGLNLRWDHFYYEAQGESWGDKSSPVHLKQFVAEGQLPWQATARVVERRGCDLNPLDPLTADGEMTLRSFVWADQTDRQAMLRGAIEVARRIPATVEKSDAAEWLESQLGNNVSGAATVVFHSIMWQYLSEEGRGRVLAALESRGRIATVDSPLAWLKMESGADQAEVRLTTWPGGEERLLATAGFHGRDVRWLVGA
jgi:hypothetical protein